MLTHARIWHFTSQSSHTIYLVVIILLHLSAKNSISYPIQIFSPGFTEFAFFILNCENVRSTKARNKFVKSFWLMTVSLFTVHCLTEQQEVFLWVWVGVCSWSKTPNSRLIQNLIQRDHQGLKITAALPTIKSGHRKGAQITLRVVFATYLTKNIFPE